MVSTPNPGNPGGGNLQDSIDKLVDAITQDMENRKRRDRKERGRKSQQRKQDKLEKAIEGLTSKLSNMGESFSSFLKPIEGFQANIRSLGLAFENESQLTMAGTLPVQTRMTATLAMLNTGLGDNQKALGKFVTRSLALNENINLLTSSFRDMRNSLGLTTEELDILGESIVHSAVTYNVATDRLAKTIADLAKKMAVLGFAGAGQSFEAISEAAARTEMAVPGGIAQILGPMMNAATEGIGSSMMAGMQDLLKRLTLNQVESSDEIFAGIQGFVDRVESRLGGLVGQGPQIMNQILRDNYNISFEQYNTMKSILEAANRTPTQLEKITANVQQAETALTQMLPAIKEPLVNMAAMFGNFFTQYPGLYKTLIYVLTVGGVAGLLTKMTNSLVQGFILLRTTLLGLNTTNKVATAMASIPIIGAVLALAVPAMVEYAAGTNDELKKLNKREERKQQGQEPVDVQRESRILSTISLGNILNSIGRANTRTSNEDSLMDKQNAMIEALLLETRASNVYLAESAKRRSPSVGGENPLR